MCTRLSSHALVLGILACALAVALASHAAVACPFCAAVSQTFSEQMQSMDAIVMARLIKAPPLPESSDATTTSELPKATFRVTQVLKGIPWVKRDSEIEVLFFGQADAEKLFLIMATNPPNLMWTTPLGLSDTAYKYITRLPELPSGYERLEFFQEYLEDKDEMLARDAYDEFARTPYDGVVALKDKMHRERLIEWIQDPQVPASRRRLYFTMLGVCGQPQDADLLEGMMQSGDRQQLSGLDALIASYLLLKGPGGLPVVEDLFLKNRNAEYQDTYAAIMAVRFHGTFVDVIDRSRLVKALRLVLDRSDIADLVIDDLAKWEDWEVLPRLIELFKQADEKSSWVRVPVVKYLRACPLPEAQKAIEELRQIDPDSIKRADLFLPANTNPGAPGPAPGSSTAPTSAAGQAQPAAEVSPADQSLAPPVPPPDTTDEVETKRGGASANRVAEKADGARTMPVSSSEPATGKTPSPPDQAPAAANLWLLLGVPILGAVVLLAAFRALLGSTRRP